MKALFISRPGVAEVREVPDPSLAAGEVLLRVSVAGFCGSDLNTYRGTNPLVTYPRIPGHEIAATVAAVGDGVPTDWRPGLPVAVVPYSSCGRCQACRSARPNCCRENQTLGIQRDGGMAEWLVVPWRRLVPAPDLTPRQIALVEPLTIGAHAADRGRVVSHDTVAVLGCGTIGIGSIAAAAGRGARVVAIDTDAAKLALAARAGASEIIDASNTDVKAALERVTGGEGPAVVVEVVGSPDTFRSAIDVVAFAGRVVCIGYARAPVEHETKLIVQKELDVLGSRNALPANFAQVAAMLGQGIFPVDELITTTVTPEEAGVALAAWDSDPSGVFRILVQM